MKLKCRLSGHRTSQSSGWCGGLPYFQIASTYTDGIGTEHAWLKARCDNCEEWYHVGMIHLPKKTPETQAQPNAKDQP